MDKLELLAPEYVWPKTEESVYSPGPDEIAELQELRVKLRELMRSRLSEREYSWLSALFGFSGRCYTQTDIAEDNEVTPSYVSHVIKKSLEKLRRAVGDRFDEFFEPGHRREQRIWQEKCAIDARARLVMDGLEFNRLCVDAAAAEVKIPRHAWLEPSATLGLESLGLPKSETWVVLRTVWRDGRVYLMTLQRRSDKMNMVVRLHETRWIRSAVFPRFSPETERLATAEVTGGL